jgi:NAD(P)H-dependent flavin oxidoreductase YrpB (nitropropane dioxygenase family)
MEAGAEAVVCGTRFVMTDESSAHPGYKARLLEARETVLTELFGLGWPVPHRVVPNEAAARWLRAGTRPPFWLRAANRAATPLVAHGPVSSQFRLLGRLASTQRAGFPMLSPAAPVAGGPGTLLEAGPLYAGESVSRIDDIRPAGEVVRALAG